MTALGANDFFSAEFFSAPDVLHNFMLFLSNFRNHESQYLQPLMMKASSILAARIQPASSLLGIEDGKKSNRSGIEIDTAEEI